MSWAVLLLGIAWLSAARADDAVPLDQLPKAVADAVKTRFPKGTVTEASKSTVDGKLEYEVTLKEAGKNIDVTLTADGVITFIEKEIADRELPKAVSAAVAKKAPKAMHQGAWVGIAVKDGKETVDYYWIDLLSATKRSVQLEIAPDGAIVQVVREITVKDLPKAVGEALQKQFPKAEYKSIEVVIAVEDGKEVRTTTRWNC